MNNITLSDIARETGYSVNTVSHALKGKPDISAKTTALICETAKKMGYIVNSSASCLRSGISNTIAIIVSDISNPHFSIMVKEIECDLRGKGYASIILNTDENEETERDAIMTAISKNVDGIIICPVQNNADNVKYIAETGIPFVLIGRHFIDVDCSFVVCDDENGGYIAAQKLIEFGHRNILFLLGNECISSAFERLAGARRAFAENNISAKNLLVENVPVLGVINDAQMKRLIRKNRSCSAIICFSDLIAFQACHCLMSMGISVPDDVSVVGFDDIVSKYRFPLMLTSVTSSKKLMSAEAVNILLGRISGEITNNVKLVLPTKLVLRETTEKFHGMS